MCRMMAIVGSREVAREMCGRFRAEATRGRVGRGMASGHADGWGIAHVNTTGAVVHAGLSTLDASRDPEYPRAVERVARGAPRGVVLEHFRKATAGGKTLTNTHPFIEEGYAFAHNGTVRGIAAPGENDSRTLFAQILAELAKGATPEDAIATLARDVDARFSYTSLTILLTDGRALWGFRRIGNDPVACAPEACPADYYTLGYARLPGGATVVSQEHEILGIEGWTLIADGELLHVDPEGSVAIRRVL